MQNKEIRTLSLTFDLPIWGAEITNWRGAFLEMAGWEEDLCHNHQSKEQYIHRYPLVQYRTMSKKANLFAINEGVEAIQRVLSNNPWDINWQGQPQTLTVEDIKLDTHYIRPLQTPKKYQLRHWVALNQDNYPKWQAAQNIIQRMQLLQKILENHVMASLWGLGYQNEQHINIQLIDLHRTKTIQFKNQYLNAFDIAFTADILLPHFIGIGKAVSHGFGICKPIPIKTKTEKTTTRATSPRLNV